MQSKTTPSPAVVPVTKRPNVSYTHSHRLFHRGSLHFRHDGVRCVVCHAVHHIHSFSQYSDAAVSCTIQTACVFLCLVHVCFLCNFVFTVPRIPAYVASETKKLSPDVRRMRLAMARIAGEPLDRFLRNWQRETVDATQNRRSQPPLEQVAEACRYAKAVRSEYLSSALELLLILLSLHWHDVPNIPVHSTQQVFLLRAGIQALPLLPCIARCYRLGGTLPKSSKLFSSNGPRDIKESLP